MTRQLVENITPQHWEDSNSEKTDGFQTPGGATNGFQRVRWLQGIVDLLNRPTLNRVTGSTNATAVSCNGAVQSAGIGTGAITPKRYAELWASARATFNLSANGTLYLYIYRTKGNVPANGAAPNAGDVAVGGDSFAGGTVSSGVNQSGAHSFIDSGLSETQAYKYYFAVKGTNAATANLVNNSQIQVSEF